MKSLLSEVLVGEKSFSFLPRQCARTVRCDPVTQCAAGKYLLVVWCKDLGEKKSELVDALSKLKLDREIVDRLRSVPSATPERSLREAEQKVESDLIAIARIERTLRAWRSVGRRNRGDPRRSRSRRPHSDRHPDDPSWARVEVRSPLDGVVLDKNVSFGDVVDTSRELFKIADLSRLAVWAHVYEEDLRRLPKPPTDWACVSRLLAGGRIRAAWSASAT